MGGEKKRKNPGKEGTKKEEGRKEGRSSPLSFFPSFLLSIVLPLLRPSILPVPPAALEKVRIYSDWIAWTNDQTDTRTSKITYAVSRNQALLEMQDIICMEFS